MYRGAPLPMLFADPTTEAAIAPVTTARRPGTGAPSRARK
jgi:hypothetical protein